MNCVAANIAAATAISVSPMASSDFAKITMNIQVEKNAPWVRSCIAPGFKIAPGVDIVI